jgi:hypothetical protein
VEHSSTKERGGAVNAFLVVVFKPPHGQSHCNLPLHFRREGAGAVAANEGTFSVTHFCILLMSLTSCLT